MTLNQPLHQLISHILEEKLAEDLVTYDVRGHHPLTDYVLLASVNNTRKMAAIVDVLREQTAKAGLPFHHIEGQPESGWMLIDLYDVIVHLFSPEMRERLEVEPILKKTINRSE